MEYFFELNLQNIAIVRLAVEFLSKRREETIKLMTKCSFENYETWKDEPFNELDVYRLPRTLMSKLKNATRYMLYELNRWIHTNSHLIVKEDLESIAQSFAWTMRGKLDIFKLTSNIFNNSNISAYNKLLWSFTYCNEDKVNSYWNNLSYMEKLRFIEYKTDNDLWQFWQGYFQKPNSIYDSITNQYLVHVTLKDINVLAAQFFWDKLGYQEKLNLLQTNCDANEELIDFFNSQPELPKFEVGEKNVCQFWMESLNNWIWHKNFTTHLNAYNHYPINKYPLFYDFLDIFNSFPVSEELEQLFLQYWIICSSDLLGEDVYNI